MTYNLYLGGADRVEAIHAVLAHARADVVLLTEADDPGVIADLAGRLGLAHVWARGSGARHIALLTRWPVSGWRIHNRRPLTQAVLEVHLDGPASPLTLYGAHLMPFLLLPFELQRVWALRTLLALIRREQPGPHLILGDLNSVAPGDRVLHDRNPAPVRRIMALQGFAVFHWAIAVLLRAGYVDCYRAAGPRDDGFTWLTGNRTVRFDYIFADAPLAARLRACRVLDGAPEVERASDHYPLVADFALDGAA
jgi:endonuclease/exonuclease/phosphatase family metal-dependent hydrolase